MSILCRRICFTAFPFFLFIGFNSLFAQGGPSHTDYKIEAEADSSSLYLPGDSVHIDSVRIEGNIRTKDRIVYREITLQSHTVYSRSAFDKNLRLSEEQLMNTSLFVTVETDTVTLNGLTSVTFKLNERWYLYPVPYFNIVDRNFNVWLKEHNASLARTNYGAKLTYYNVSGRNDEVNLWAINGYTQQLQLRYSNPFSDNKMVWGYRVGALYNRNREMNYINHQNKQLFRELGYFGAEKFEGEVTLSYRKGSKFRGYLKNYFVHQNIDTAFYRLNPNLLGGRRFINYVDVIFNLQYYNVDYIPFPLRGWYVDGFLQQRFSSSVPMFKIGGKALATWSFLPHTYLNLQTAFALSPKRNLPFINRRLIGYDYLYIQGLENYVIDGNAGAFARGTVRYRLFEKNFKGPRQLKAYQIIPIKLFLKTYGNLGYAHSSDPGSSYMNNMLLRTFGFGVEIMTIHDLVGKFEYSFNQFGERGFFLHTTFDF